MNCASRPNGLGRSARTHLWSAGLLFFFTCLLLQRCHAELPRRLVLFADGVAFRDMKALQEGVTYATPNGRLITRQNFNEGYYPVSKMISTFPSASDVAWTDILGGRPLPGYQRTYFCAATGKLVVQNGVSTSMEYELQMNWQMESSFLRAFGYLHPYAVFKREVRQMVKHFLEAKNQGDTFYAMIRATDDAQHTSGDIFGLLAFLDQELKELRAEYRKSEGRELEILILSDHGNNHAGAGERVDIQSFLKAAGYRVTDELHGAKDVVLPTVGIQNWIELHCSPNETERIFETLPDLEGVDLITARSWNNPQQFFVINSKRERATIDWNQQNNSFRYTTERGDPLGYAGALRRLAADKKLSVDGFAAADDWMKETINQRYPLALERIARGQSTLTLNPAPILIALKNGYVHCSPMLKQLSSLRRIGGTHGALDDLCSDGIVLSSFAPTRDTSTSRIAALYDGFSGLMNYRTTRQGAEWTERNVQLLASRTASTVRLNSSDKSRQPRLTIWTPQFAENDFETPIEAVLQPMRRLPPARVHRFDPEPTPVSKQLFRLDYVSDSAGACERIYQLPDSVQLEPDKSYRFSGSFDQPHDKSQVFDIVFQTDRHGKPVVR